MIDFDNRCKCNINFEKIEKIYNELSSKDLEFIITTNDEIQQINCEFRGVDKPTDVLSFPLEEMLNAPLGTIIISYDKAKEVALELGHNIDDEIAILFIHGVLHLLGFDHEKDSGDMRAKEIELIEKFNLPKSLIVRTDICD